jgi:hypothetical protein
MSANYLADYRLGNIESGRDAWHRVGKAESFENWKALGAALTIGKQRALNATATTLARGITSNGFLPDCFRTLKGRNMRTAI